jgi:predicted nucleic acid-binding protein
MIVVDASVLGNALVYTDERGRKARAALARDTQWAAPEHWMVEVFSVLRGLTLGGKIEVSVAEQAVGRLTDLGIDHVPIASLLPTMWAYRSQMTANDAGYVALAAVRGVTLVTADARLATSATRHCGVSLVA